MYYVSITVETKVGKRFDGIAHLKKFTTWAKDKYGVSTEVLGNLVGKIYVNHLVMKVDSLAHWEELQEKMLKDPEYLAWFNEGADLITMQSARQHVYQVF